jgi:RNase P/RNase MRP subunit p30
MAIPTGSEDLRRHIRDDKPRSDDIVVVRGGSDSLAKLATHERRTHRAFKLDGAAL